MSSLKVEPGKKNLERAPEGTKRGVTTHLKTIQLCTMIETPTTKKPQHTTKVMIAHITIMAVVEVGMGVALARFIGNLAMILEPCMFFVSLAYVAEIRRARLMYNLGVCVGSVWVSILLLFTRFNVLNDFFSLFIHDGGLTAEHTA